MLAMIRSRSNKPAGLSEICSQLFDFTAETITVSQYECQDSPLKPTVLESQIKQTEEKSEAGTVMPSGRSERIRFKRGAHWYRAKIVEKLEEETTKEDRHNMRDSLIWYSCE